ncbi:MAG TPA: hypothetical protein VKF14_10935 [Candidatus Dormibacteraeota bacterium]|nr:hypothetical protein [Candidatus Dormibacteraeota bacterium]
MVTRQPIPSGWAVFAGTILLIVGIFNAIYGLVALFRPRAITVSGQGVIVWDFSTWGWILLAIGIVQIAVSLGLFAVQGWARWMAIGVAGLSAVAQIAFFTAYPLWSLLVILLDVLVIWQLSMHWQPEADGQRGATPPS